MLTEAKLSVVEIIIKDGKQKQRLFAYGERPSDIFHANASEGDRATLCKITVEVIHDSLGREIVRKPKSKTGPHQ